MFIKNITRKKSVILRSPISLLLLGFVISMTSLVEAHEGHAAVEPKSQQYVSTQLALRDLWVEHVFWVRNYVVGTNARDVDQAAAAEEQIVANAKAIAGAVGSFYGEAANEEMFKLLAGHWSAIKAYAGATGKKDKPASEKALADLTSNAKAISKFLAGANPFLPEKDLFQLLSAHGAHHVSQIAAISDGDFAEEAIVWGHMRHHMHTIADALTGALATQFPEKFK